MKTLATVLAFLTLTAASAHAQAPAPTKPCADPIPPDCKTVKFLGEDKGCACFACFSDTKQRKVVCTKNEDDRRTLLKLKDQATKTPSATPPATPEAAPRGAK